MAEDTREGMTLIEAVRAGDRAATEALLDAGAPLDQRDEHGWAALDWAAGAGDAAMAELLLARGADPLASGEDQRRPYQIALAAGRLEAAALLRAAEERTDPSLAAERAWRPYCRAYELGALRRFAGWREPAAVAGEAADSGGEEAGGEEAGGEAADGGGEEAGGEEAGPLRDDSIVYLHDDLVVTRSSWPGEEVIFDAVCEDWARFCREELGFRVPDDFDLVPSPSGG